MEHALVLETFEIIKDDFEKNLWLNFLKWG